MATIYTKAKCPYCGFTYNRYSNHNKTEKTDVGCPFLLCGKCGKLFVDEDIIEPALEKEQYENLKKPSIFACSLYYLFPFGLAGILSTVCAINGAPEAWILGIPSYFFYIFLTVLLIRNRDRMVLIATQEYNKSLERMKSLEYLQALQNAGFEIPQEYFDNADTQVSLSEVLLKVQIERELKNKKKFF